MYDQEQKSNGKLTRRMARLAKLEMRVSSVRGLFSKGGLNLVSLFLMLITVFHPTSATLTTPPHSLVQRQSLSNRATNDSGPLECLQVGPPVLSPAGECRQTLMVHTFAFSYGQPFIGEYYPPACNFNRVTFNFTVTSAGRQFDRLALMFFDDIEIFRTSTAEPTRNGIIWTYVKDMSNYLPLFQTPQKIIFDLGNLVDDTYTGLWNTTLTATFFTVEDSIEPADVVFPISARRSKQNLPSGFVVPESKAIDTLRLPQNAKKAIFSISACGQATEEFWWSNVLNSDTHVFGNDTELYGHSPFRELQLFIDGSMAGLAWPFPTIFTGGIVPGFWRPIVGLDAFDLREDEIDITPFIPLLSDNKSHTFEIRVIGIDDDGQGNALLTENIGSNWVVTGKVFLWLDKETSLTTGTPPRITASDPVIRLKSTRQGYINGTAESLDYSINVSRNFYIESNILTPSGVEPVYWKQNLTFSNSGTLSNKGNDQTMRQSTAGIQSSSSKFSRNFEYPLWVISSYNAPPGGNLTIDARMGRGKYVQQLGDLAFPNDVRVFDYTRLPPGPTGPPATFRGSNVNNWQNGTAAYLSVPAQKRSYGSGSTEQLFSLTGISDEPIAMVQDGVNVHPTATRPLANDELYRRHIVAANDTVVYDDERLGGQVRGWAAFAAPTFHRGPDGGLHEFAAEGARGLLGRGPE